MFRWLATGGRRGGRGRAVVGLGGAVLATLGDVLILGRSASGAEFDQATGMVPPHIKAESRWRSLWNGAGLSEQRIWAGTLIGVVGIGGLGLGLDEVARTVRPGALRTVASASAAAFALAGAATHLTCGVVVLAYRRAAVAGVEAAGEQPSPRSATGPLGASALGSLGALAVLSAALNVAALRSRTGVPTRWPAVTPFACVLATLLGFGRLPGPVGGYARPASISLGLLMFFLAESRR